CSFALPLTCFQLPSIWSQFIGHTPLVFKRSKSMMVAAVLCRHMGILVPGLAVAVAPIRGRAVSVKQCRRDVPGIESRLIRKASASGYPVVRQNGVGRTP